MVFPLDTRLAWRDGGGFRRVLPGNEEAKTVRGRRQGGLLDPATGVNSIIASCAWNKENSITTKSKEDFDSLRNLDEIFTADPRHARYRIYDGKLHGYRYRTIEDHHKLVTKLALHDRVPELVNVHFEIARNLYLYTWFVYRFAQVAESQAMASVEFALKERIDAEKLTKLRGLKARLNFAVEQDWIQDKNFRQYHRILKEQESSPKDTGNRLSGIANIQHREEIQNYSQVITDVLPNLRNDLAHGSSTLTPDIYLTLEICCDIINQLF